MKKDIKIPALGESIRQVTIGAILKPSGSEVMQDEEILELETDKLNQVLYAPESGILDLSVKQGDTATIGDVIGSIEVKSVEKKSAPKPEVSQEVNIAQQAKEEWLQELDLPAAITPQTVTTAAAPVTKEDVRKPMSSLKKAMGKKMLEASHETAMLTTFNEVDMSEVIKLRELYKEQFIAKYKTKLGFMSFFVKAAVSALQAYPEVNSYIQGDDQIYRSSIDIGVAVSSERGLVVPVLKGADSMSFAQIEQKIDDYAARAKSGGLQLDELRGGGFTITNGGLFGSMLSTPILNPPQAAILGMHKIAKRAVVVDDQIVIRPIMYLALSYDHRILDGKEAVSFLVHIKNMVEDPHRLELGV
ncbi:MAG: dihydrolipoyllysine-residue succinyltransferase [Verrucomicrobia bacterium]|nr:dihydrolipoyllysine-residue succinyltransferase [Verrucomicrobiota bacterium]